MGNTEISVPVNTISSITVYWTGHKIGILKYFGNPNSQSPHPVECNPEKVCRILHSKSSVNREGPHESLRYTVGGKLKNIWRFHEFFRRVHMLCYFMHYF